MNRILTLSEFVDNLYGIALEQVGGDARAAKVLLALSSPMVECPPKDEIQYLQDVLKKIHRPERPE